MYNKTLLINENGDEFTGWSIDNFNPATGELIFNTAMTGFVEILSDPSYINQILTFTSSHVGNYGISSKDYESNKPRVEAVIGNSFTSTPSSWRSENSITSWLKEYEIPFSGGFDVRSITKHLRDNGSSMYAVGQNIDKKSLLNLLENAKNIIGDDSALTAGSLETKDSNTDGKVGIIDLGAKQSIVNVLNDLNFETIAKIPIFGICLGHQILSLACGLEVKKLDFGHHGSNHPVEISGIKKALITAQNHGFAVENFDSNYKHDKYGRVEVYAKNLNDGSNEGISIWDSMAYSVQFHPESGPGTSDGLQIFDPFVELMEKNYAKK